MKQKTPAFFLEEKKFICTYKVFLANLHGLINTIYKISTMVNSYAKYISCELRKVAWEVEPVVEVVIHVFLGFLLIFKYTHIQ